MRRALFAAALLFLVAAKPPKIYRSSDLADLEALVPVLRRHVAYLAIEAKNGESAPLDRELRDGFAAVLGDKHVVTLCFLVADAEKITIEGANGKKTLGRVVLFDVERRVAIVESKDPLKTLGLEAAPIAPPGSRESDDEVFALTTTGLEAAILHGVFTYTGDEPEYGGHHRIDLQLGGGVPVFDRQARFAGFSRTVAWDKDRQMLVTPEMIRDARTATSAVPAATKDRPNEKPWWSK
jgi:hypothetical protein